MSLTWADSTRLAGMLVPPGPRVSRSRARSAVATIVESTPVVEDLLAELTGLDYSVTHGLQVRVVDRQRWIHRLGRTLRHLADASPVPAGRSVANPVRACALSFMMGVAATRMYGHCDPTEPQAPIYVVIPNVVRTERAEGLDAWDFRQWVMVRSALYAVQFRAAPWLLPYLRERINRVMRAYGAEDIGDLSLMGLWRSLRMLDVDVEPEFAPRRPVRTRQRGYTPSAAVAALAEAGTETEDGIGISARPDGAAGETSAIDQALLELTQLVGLLDAYVRVIMEGLTPLHIPSIQRIRALLGTSPTPTDVLLRTFGKVVGASPIHFSSVQARRFLHAVIATCGREGANQVFSSPVALPTMAEIADPSLWMARMRQENSL